MQARALASIANAVHDPSTGYVKRMCPTFNAAFAMFYVQVGTNYTFKFDWDVANSSGESPVLICI
jgi:hypothetical protein